MLIAFSSLLGKEPQVLPAPVCAYISLELCVEQAGTHELPSSQHAAAWDSVCDVFQVSDSITQTFITNSTLDNRPSLHGIHYEAVDLLSVKLNQGKFAFYWKP